MRSLSVILGGCVRWFPVCSVLFALASASQGALGPAPQRSFIGRPASQHVGPPRLYPNPDWTPGMADTVNVEDLTDTYECPTSNRIACTYSQAHREVSSRVRKAIYDEYSVPQDQRNAKGGEVDHFDPLCNGGSNNKENLWFQPIKNMWNGKNFGYKEKDSLEDWICAQVKHGKLDPLEAFGRITSDWVAYYMEVNPKNVQLRD